MVERQTEELKILFTSDIHGNASPILYGTNDLTETGLTKYMTVVKEERARNKDVIVIDNGDLIQGTPFMTHYVKAHFGKTLNPMINLMNQIGIDAGIIGNHEFNFGKEVLHDAIEESNFPWLSANILNKETSEPYFGPPYKIMETEAGVKVVIVGVTTHYIPNWESPKHIANMSFEDAFSILKLCVDYINDVEKPDLLIASYHGGFERDIESGEPTEVQTGENQGYKMCQEIEGIDILLTGHQHREIIGYLNDVLIVQPGKNGLKYAEINVTLNKNDREWIIDEKKASLHSFENIPSDPAGLDTIKALEKSTQTWLDQPIGHIIGDMAIEDPFKVRLDKHPFIEFIQNVQMEASGVDISAVSLFNNKSTGFSNEVTMREVVSNYMYPNTLVVLEITGEDMLAALEKSANYFTIDTEGNIAINPTYLSPKAQHYNYDMWEGINYTIRVSNPEGSRVTDITYHGKEIEPLQLYRVALNNYRAGGGGDFTMFKDKPVIKDIQVDTVELIRAYFEKHQEVEATRTNNFKVIK